MAEHAYSLDADLKETEALLGGFVPYIYEGELYGNVGINLPRLTPGALLLRLSRLEALRAQMNAGQRDRFMQLHTRHVALQVEWGVHYQEKLAREFESRLKDIRTFITECRDDPRLCASAYLPEALRRTMLHLILEAVSADRREVMRTQLKKVDQDLRQYTEDCGFIWDPVLEPVYPRDPFWWLHSCPPEPR